MNALAGLLTNPEAGNRLRAIARIPTDSERALQEAIHLTTLNILNAGVENQHPARER